MDLKEKIAVITNRVNEYYDDLKDNGIGRNFKLNSKIFNKLKNDIIKQGTIEEVLNIGVMIIAIPKEKYKLNITEANFDIDYNSSKRIIEYVFTKKFKGINTFCMIIRDEITGLK